MGTVMHGPQLTQVLTYQVGSDTDSPLEHLWS
jgi:hypothetical protein